MSVYTHGHLFYALDYSALLYILLFKQFPDTIFGTVYLYLEVPNYARNILDAQ